MSLRWRKKGSLNPNSKPMFRTRKKMRNPKGFAREINSKRHLFSSLPLANAFTAGTSKFVKHDLREETSLNHVILASRAQRRWRLKPPARSSITKGSSRFVLFVRRVYSEKMTFVRTIVQVNGQVLRNALRNIFRESEGFTLTKDQGVEVRSFSNLSLAQILNTHTTLRTA